MTTPVVFQLNGNLLDGNHVPGEYQWSQDVILGSAFVTVSQPFGGMMTLELEVGGVLTGISLVMTPMTAAQPFQSSLLLRVPAGQSVRWVASVPEPAVTAPAQVTIAVTWSLAGSAAAEQLIAQWVDGGERLMLYTYANGIFTDVSNGASAGRATITTSGGFQLYFQGEPVIEVEAGTFYASFFGVGVPVTGTAQLLFVSNGLVLATVTSQGLWVNNMAEQAVTLPVAAGAFSFADGSGTVVATLDGTGLTVSSAVETGFD